MSTVHVLYDGSSHDFDFSDIINPETAETLGISSSTELTPSNITEAQMKAAVSMHMDIAPGSFNSYTVSFEKNGNITVRPEAVFG